MLPTDYADSRDRFLDLARELGVEPRRFFHGGAADAFGLSTDTVYLGPADARRVVVIASGTHGVEGYAGAACQFRFMEQYRNNYAHSGLGFLLVHAVNPWGFFHDRRVTREGVDLNRNFIDFSRTHAERSGYADYHALLVSRYRPLPAGWWNELRLLSCGLTRRRRAALQAAITAGQHDHPDGLFFSGSAPTECRLVWEEIVRRHVYGRDAAFLLDLHTGLGKYGVGELISTLPSSAPAFRRMSEWFHGDLKSMASGDAVSAVVDGTLTAAFERTVPGQSHAVGLEFGTRPPLAVLNALRADHWYHNNAASLAPASGRKVRQKMKQAFATADPQWHAKIAARFDVVIVRIIAGFGGTG
jgi:Protein of unknown function (DUF2817)